MPVLWSWMYVTQHRLRRTNSAAANVARIMSVPMMVECGMKVNHGVVCVTRAKVVVNQIMKTVPTIRIVTATPNLLFADHTNTAWENRRRKLLLIRKVTTTYNHTGTERVVS